MKFIFLFSAAFVLATNGLAQNTGDSRGCDMTDVTRAVCARERELIEALLRNDHATVSQIYADDFVLVNYRGSKVNKTGVLDALRTGTLRFDSLVISELQARPYDGTVIVMGRQRQVAREPGPDERPHAKDVRYTNIYVRKDNIWRLVSTQITPLLPRPEAQIVK